MKPTMKILLAVSAIVSINLLADFYNNTVNDAYADTAASVRQPMGAPRRIKHSSKPTDQTYQSTYVPSQGQSTTASGYGTKPWLGGPKPNKPATTSVNPKYTGGRRSFDTVRNPQQASTYPANVTSTSADDISF
jgi:hypothetical protein